MARDIGLALPSTWTGVDAVRPLLEHIRRAGALWILKLDGLRKPPHDAPPYTVVVRDGPAADGAFRTDAPSIETALTTVLASYGRAAWAHTPSVTATNFTSTEPASAARARLATLASARGIELDAAWSGVDAVWPLLDALRAEGAVVVLLLRGTCGPGQEPYTAELLRPGAAAVHA
ncbi:hypothetical protein L6R52_42010, partial [Myxococcota bacterium]|nr:hypothetical protein [Myxococcota bacterium]